MQYDDRIKVHCLSLKITLSRHFAVFCNNKVKEGKKCVCVYY